MSVIFKTKNRSNRRLYARDKSMSSKKKGGRGQTRGALRNQILYSSREKNNVSRQVHHMDSYNRATTDSLGAQGSGPVTPAKTLGISDYMQDASGSQSSIRMSDIFWENIICDSESKVELHGTVQKKTT